MHLAKRRPTSALLALAIAAGALAAPLAMSADDADARVVRDHRGKKTRVVKRSPKRTPGKVVVRDHRDPGKVGTSARHQYTSGTDDPKCQRAAAAANSWIDHGKDEAVQGNYDAAGQAYGNADAIAGQANAAGCTLFQIL